MLLMMLLGGVEDNLARTIDKLQKDDLKVFERADGRFGVGRMSGSTQVFGKHGLWVGLDPELASIERFLVGNRRDSFTKDMMRVQFVSRHVQSQPRNATAPETT